LASSEATTAFFSAAGIARYGVHRGFLGPTTNVWSFRCQSFTVIVIEATGFARGATDGSVRIDTAIHAAKTSANTARTARILRKRLADRIR
jgi:hypothetical protein